jgi:drug/metabolite transporter (DMT)-like permease
MSGNRNENLGYFYGFLGVAAFALTLPATRIAVRVLDPVFIGLGRALGAAMLAALYLAVTRARLPSLAEAGRLAVVAAGVVVGFPVLTAWAMRHVDASHGGVVLGILPLATVMAGFVLNGERPSARFWVFAVLGSALVVGYSLLRAGGAIEWADLALLGAVASAAVGYAQGARLAQAMGGMQVISWTLVIAAPFIAIPVWLTAPVSLGQPASAWIAFAYVMLISQFLGFVPWYRGLALGGIAKVSQVQLLQPFLTILASVFIVGEPADAMTWVVALLVVAVVAAGKSSRVAVKAH